MSETDDIDWHMVHADLLRFKAQVDDEVAAMSPRLPSPHQERTRDRLASLSQSFDRMAKDVGAKL